MVDTRADHMPDRVSVRGVMVAVLAIGGGIAVSIATALWLVDASSVTSAVRPPTLASAPRLQAAPAQDIAAYRAEKQRRLNEYAWVDREHGVVRIPIQRAMQILAAKAAQ